MISLDSIIQLFGGCFVAIFLYQCMLFGIACYKKNNGIADIGWGLGLIVISLVSMVHYVVSCLFEDTFGGQIHADRVFLLMILFVTAWGLRLSIYLFVRNWSKSEDWRYAKWRQEWGHNFYLRSFFQVFMLQGFLMVVIGSPILLASFDHTYGYGLFQWIIVTIGSALWLIGFFFEAVSDYQLAQFKKDPANKGRVMKYGVWQYTRHPNYFGEASMWWGIFLLSCVSAQGVVDVLLRMVGPALLTFMLLRVSGVTMLESKYKGNKEYEDYQKRTSAFIPMPTKKGAV